MKDELPPPEFDSGHYERPTHKWVCGRAADGQSCRIGPDQRGDCRATFECSPAFDVKEGEVKGRYRCMRPKEFGGACESGPRPDGTCGRPIARCAPVRSVRARRGLVTWYVTTATVALLLIALAGPKRLLWINPGPLSDPHSTEAFARLHGGGTNEVSGCVACHQNAHDGIGGWLHAAIHSSPGPFDWRALAAATAPSMNAIDESCQKCHPGRAFHAPNVVREHSCSACHQEHRGTLALHRPDDRNCASCHGDADVMEASYEMGRTLSASAFDFRPDLGRFLFKTPRPERGFTKVFHDFGDHPEFQVIAENLRESNTLKFNHRRHFAPDIPEVNGRKLDCASCHQPDASGQFHLRIRFEDHCKSCHSLQFDAANPGMTLPHGSADAVRAFLRSLPAQYADYATRELGVRGKREVDAFVREQLTRLQGQAASIDDLEQKVFFSDRRWSPAARVGTMTEGGNPRYYGCAYCHEVTPLAIGAPVVTPPAIPDRWLIRGSFDHRRHAHVDCATCHDVTRSEDTADILLPSKNSCATCHSSQGGVAHSCATCHKYHTPRRSAVESIGARLERP